MIEKLQVFNLKWEVVVQWGDVGELQQEGRQTQGSLQKRYNNPKAKEMVFARLMSSVRSLFTQASNLSSDVFKRN